MISAAAATQSQPTWRRVTLGDITKQVAIRVGQQSLPVCSCSKLYGVLPQSARFKVRIASKSIAHYKVLDDGEFVFDPMLLWDGSIGLNRTGKAGAVSPAYTVFRSTPDVDPLFLEFVLRQRSMCSAYKSVSVGTNVRRQKVKYRDFAGLSVLMPNLSEQRTIASALSTIQRATEATQAVAASAAIMRVTLAKDLFGRCRLAPTTKLGDVARIGNGSTPLRSRADYWYRGEIPWLTSRKVHDGVIQHADEFVTQVARQECHLPFVPKRSVLIAITGQGKTLGNAAITDIEACVSQHLAYITLHSDRLMPEFLWHYLRSRYHELQEAGRAGGSTKAALTCAWLSRYEVPVPPLDAQLHVVNTLDTLDRKVRAEHDVTAALKSVFQSALSQLLGETEDGAA